MLSFRLEPLVMFLSLPKAIRLNGSLSPPPLYWEAFLLGGLWEASLLGGLSAVRVGPTCGRRNSRKRMGQGSLTTLQRIFNFCETA